MKIDTYRKRLIANGLAMLISGGLIFYYQRQVAEDIVSLIFVVLAGAHLIDFIGGLLLEKTNRRSSFRSLVKAAFWVAMVFLAGSATLSVNLIIRFIGFYQLINALARIITFGLYQVTKTKGSWRFLLDGLIFASFGLGALLSPDKNRQIHFLLIGGYLFALGLTYLRDGLFFEKPKRYDDFRRRIRISLPVWLAFLLPQAALSEVNKQLAGDYKPKTSLAGEKFAPSDLQIMVHTAQAGFNRVGHVDICFEGVVISYGNYDDDSLGLAGTIGDGVLFEAEKTAYIDFCRAVSGKTLFEYGLKLSDEQKRSVKNKILELKASTYDWQPDQKKAEDQKPDRYAVRLKQELGAKLFKFKSGKFKKYFVLNTNCVMLADQIVGASGTDILTLNGIITPGTYLDYLNREFAKPNSLVVSKVIHRQSES